MAFSPPFAGNGMLGALNLTFTALGTDGYDNPPFAAGTMVEATDASEWIYVLAATAINLGDCVSIDRNGNASQMTNALATAALTRVGFASVVAIPSGSYGWVAIRGDALPISVLTGTAAGAALYTTATAGILSSTSASQVQIYGVVVTTANASGSTTTEPAMATAPRLVN